MKINKTLVMAVLLFGLLVGGLAAGVFLSQRPTSVDAAPAVQQPTLCPDDDNIQDENKNEADDATEAVGCDKNEADEANDQDNTQEEHENQADDASEAPGVEDVAGQ